MSFSIAFIGGLTRIRTGKLDANAAVQGGQYPFFTCAQAPLNIDKYAYDCDAILVAGNGDLNVKHYKGKFDAYQRTYIIEVSEKSKLDSRYLYYFMSKYVEKLRELSISGVIKYIKLGMLTDAEIPLPLLAEQKRIVTILDKADAMRSMRRQAIQLADEFLRSVFLDMFGDPVTNPKGYNSAPLGDLVEIISGGTPSRVEKRFWNGMFPWVSPKDMKSLTISNSIEKISENVFSETSLKRIPKKSILIVIRGMILAHTIPIAITAEEVAINQDIKALKTRNSLLPEFLLWSLLVQHNFILSKVSTAAHGTKRLDTANLQQIKIQLPSIELQNRFIEIVYKFSKIKNKSTFSLKEAENLFYSLVQKAFRGEL